MRQRWIYGLILGVAVGLSLPAQEKLDALKEYRQGNYEQAIAICKKELQENPNNADSYVVLCWSLLKLNRYNEAEPYAQKGLSLYRYDPRLIEIMGEIRYYQGNNQEALRYFQQYINLAPEGGRVDVVYYFMGELYIRLGRYRHADIALSTAVRYVQGNAFWWNRLGFARENAGELQGALAAYERALSLNSQLTDAQRGRERVLQSLQNRNLPR